MSSKHLVCQGATCQCNFGTTTDKLKVFTQSKRYINDKDALSKLMATHMDLGSTFEKNSFGSCAKQKNNPCVAVVNAWSGYYEKITLADNNGHALLEDSRASCPIGGKDCIVIINHGQTVELTKRDIENASPEIMMELFPLVNLKALFKDINLPHLPIRS